MCSTCQGSGFAFFMIRLSAEKRKCDVGRKLLTARKERAEGRLAGAHVVSCMSKVKTIASTVNEETKTGSVEDCGF